MTRGRLSRCALALVAATALWVAAALMMAPWASAGRGSLYPAAMLVVAMPATVHAVGLVLWLVDRKTTGRVLGAVDILAGVAWLIAMALEGTGPGRLDATVFWPLWPRPVWAIGMIVLGILVVTPSYHMRISGGSLPV